VRVDILRHLARYIVTAVPASNSASATKRNTAPYYRLDCHYVRSHDRDKVGIARPTYAKAAASLNVTWVVSCRHTCDSVLGR
jgi:hypothetical protein